MQHRVVKACPWCGLCQGCPCLSRVEQHSTLCLYRTVRFVLFFLAAQHSMTRVYHRSFTHSHHHGHLSFVITVTAAMNILGCISSCMRECFHRMDSEKCSCSVLEYFLFCVNRYRPCLPCMMFSTPKISEPCFLLSQMGMLFFGYHQFAYYFLILSPAHLLRPSSLWIMALGSHFYFLLCHPTRLALSQPHPLFPSSGKPLAMGLHVFPIVVCCPHSPYSLTEERQIWKEWRN